MSTAEELIIHADVVTDGEVVRDGWVLVDEGTIVDFGTSASRPPAARTVTDAAGASVLPGFVDIHVHGGGGHSFGGGRASDVAAAEFHAMWGTTALLTTLSTRTPAETLARVRELGTLPEVLEHGGRVLGIHLEGPYISLVRKGAHDPDLVRPPDTAELASLVGAGGGRVRLITAAPELPGFGDLARVAASSGVLIAAGHTDADGPQFLGAIAGGARSLTHTFNGMRPVSHRLPAVLEAIVDSPVFCELICDGVHVHPTFVRMLRALAGPERVVLVTDAVAWAGHPDGQYQSQGREVDVRDGGVYLRGTSTLAGSTLTMAEAARRYARYTGAGLVEIAAVTSTNAARVLGEDHRVGRIRRGHLADLVVLDQELHCIGVMSNGRWARPLGASPEALRPPGTTGDIADQVANCHCDAATGPAAAPEPGIP